MTGGGGWAADLTAWTIMAVCALGIVCAIRILIMFAGKGKR